MQSQYPNIQDIPEVSGAPQAAAPAPQQPQAPVSGAQTLMNPIIGAMKVIGASIKAQQDKGNPNAGAMSQAFSGLLQNMSGQAQAPKVATPQVVGQPQLPQAAPAPVQQQPVPQAAPAPQPQGGGPTSMPRPAAGTQPVQGQRPMNGARPFGQTPGQRPISKQPVLI